MDRVAIALGVRGERSKREIEAASAFPLPISSCRLPDAALRTPPLMLFRRAAPPTTSESGRRRAAGDRSGTRGRVARHKPGRIRRWLASFSRASPRTRHRRPRGTLPEKAVRDGQRTRSGVAHPSGAGEFSSRSKVALRRFCHIVLPRRGRIPAPSSSPHRPRCSPAARGGWGGMIGVVGRRIPLRRLSSANDDAARRNRRCGGHLIRVRLVFMHLRITRTLYR
jgi:hypothetical protein